MRPNRHRVVLLASVIMLFILLLLSGCEPVWRALVSISQITPDAAAPIPLATMPGWGTPVSGFTFPTTAPPAPLGVDRVIGSVTIRVNQVLRPGNAYVERAPARPALQEGKEYMVVWISVYCQATAQQDCHVTEFDFGIHDAAGNDDAPEFASSLWGLNGLFEGGDLAPGTTTEGFLVFQVDVDQTGLTLTYPRSLMLPGSSASFQLEQ